MTVAHETPGLFIIFQWRRGDNVFKYYKATTSCASPSFYTVVHKTVCKQLIYCIFFDFVVCSCPSFVQMYIVLPLKMYVCISSPLFQLWICSHQVLIRVLTTELLSPSVCVNFVTHLQFFFHVYHVLKRK